MLMSVVLVCVSLTVLSSLIGHSEHGNCKPYPLQDGLHHEHRNCPGYVHLSYFPPKNPTLHKQSIYVQKCTVQASPVRMLNVTLCPSFQEPLRASQAPAAAVLTIPSPTSSPWGALPSPWPHLWSSPATPCITAVKTMSWQRPLRPPRPRMTRDPRPLLSPPPRPSTLTDLPTAAKTNIPKPVPCRHFLHLSVTLILLCSVVTIWTVEPSHIRPDCLANRRNLPFTPSSDPVGL